MSHSKRVRVIGAVVALVGVLGLTSLFGGLGALAQEGGPEQIAEADQQGREAIEAVGDRLPEVAAAMDMAPQELASVLASDSAAWLDTAGRLYYVDPVHAEPAEAAAEEIPPAPKPLSETFKLHSLPGAKRVIYLDFDGYEAAGSVWANGRTDTYAEPWSRDGDDSTFSDSERQAIQEIWRLVAEDFAPFAVDVTTEDPGTDRIRRTNSGDDLYGTTVAISPNIIRDCSCGGVAYVDVFDVHGQFNDGTYIHDYYQPAWVVGSSGTSVKTIAEAASHEAGHNLSLGHDGTSDRSYFAGHGDWAPIMGVGYYRSVTQWSRGEYSDANNSEDDLALIDAAGAPIRADDHGHDAASGTALTDSNVDVSGVIATRSDKDAFSFTTAGGQVTVAVAPAQDGPNLDTSLALVDSAGNLVASSTSSGLGSSLDQAVGAGTYALVVDGVGAGDPSSSGYSDYASLGNFTLTGTVPLGVAPPPPPQSCDGLTRQAEDGQMFGGFVAGNNGGTGFAWVPTGQPHNYTGADTTDSRVDLCFTVSNAGLYRIDTRVLGPTWDADSFYVTVDGGPAGDGYLWDTTRSSSFQVDSVSNRDGLDPLKVDLSAGEHIVSFHLREAGTAIDWATLVAEDPDPRPTCSGLTQNAANGTLLGDFVAGNDGGTSFAWVPTGQPHNYNGADATESRVDLCFNVTEAGAYKIDTTVLGPTWDADSFYVTVDGTPGGDGYLWDTVRSSSFQSDPVSDRGGADPLTVNLSAGEHIVSFHLREAGTRLGQVSLVKSGTPPPPSCGGLSQEAEAGTLFGDFVIGNDASGQFVWLPTGEPHNYNGADATDSRVELCFTVTQAGTYRIDTQVMGPTWDADSFYVTIDDAPAGDGHLWDTTRSGSYQLDAVSSRGGGDPLTVSLNAGEHTVGFHLREAGTRLGWVGLVRTGD